MGYRLNDEAVAARDDWVSTFGAPLAAGAERIEPALLAAELRKSMAGQKLVAIGMEHGILAAAQIDRFRSVPELDPRTLRIRLPSREGGGSPRRHGGHGV